MSPRSAGFRHTARHASCLRAGRMAAAVVAFVALSGSLDGFGCVAVAGLQPLGLQGPPPLSGAYSVGAGQPPPFNTLTSTVNYLNGVGIAGPVTFLLTDSSYTAPNETFPITLTAIPGASPLDRITIRPAPGVTTRISGSTAGAVLRLNGADFITIEGSGDESSSRDLTIINSSPSGGTAAVWLSSMGPGAGCTDNAIRNCILACGADQSQSSTETFGLLVAGPVVATNSDGSDNDRNELSRNLVIRCRWGVYLRGSAVAPNLQNRIEANVVGPVAFGPDQLGRGGIIVQYQDQLSISRNEIRCVGARFSNPTPGTDRIGIGLGGFSWPGPATAITNSQVSRNLIHDIVDEKTFSAVGILVAGLGSPSGNRIDDNMVHDIRANGTAGDQAVGIGIGSGTGDLVAFNSVSLSGDLDPPSTTTATWSAAGLRISSTATTHLVLLNNILDVDLQSNTPALAHYAIVVPTAAYNWGSGRSDNNDLHAEPSNAQAVLGATGTAMPYAGVSSLPAWRALFTPTQDLASISDAPPFVGSGNLHLLPDALSPLRAGGTPVIQVTEDFDGQARDPVTPDIGADEVRLLSRAEATQLVLDQVVQGHPHEAELVGFLYNKVAPDSLLPPGSVVADYDSTFIRIVEEPSYFFWLDDKPNAIWSHATTFALVGAGSGDVTVQAGQSWPVVDTLDVDRFYVEGNASPELITGAYDTVVDLPFPYAPVAGGNSNAWAIIFLGEVRQADEKSSHEKDINRAKQILNAAPLGPRVPPENIKTLTGPNFCGTSKKAFCDELDALPGCDKLFVYYLGHGNSGNGGNMGMRNANGKGEKFSYKDLAEKLKAKGIRDVCLVVDCCYSALAIKHLEKAGLKGTVITAAGDTREGHRTPGVGWNLTVALQICMNDTLSDLNRDKKISLLEGLVWARGLNSTLVADGATGEILDDKEKTDIPAPVCTNLGQQSDGESNQICFIDKTHKYSVGKTSVSRRSLYVYNLSTAEEHRGVPNQRIEVICTDANGGNRTVKKLKQINLAKKGDPAGKDRICLFDLDPKCEKITFKLVNAAPAGTLRPASAPPLRDDRSLLLRSGTYDPGEFLFHALPVSGAPGDHFTAAVENIPGWNLSVDPPLFSGPAGTDTAWVFVSGIAPPGATQGEEFFATIINTTTPDTVDWTFHALLSDTLVGPVTGGQSFEYQDIRASAGLDVVGGQAMLTRSRLRVQAPTTCALGPAGSLILHEAIVVPDSGVGYSFTAQGFLDWDGSCLIEPTSGLRLLGASGILSLGSVYGSRSDGLFVSGDQSGILMHQFLIENSVRDGIVFDATSNARFRGLRVFNSGRHDVTLQNSAVATLVDAGYDDAKISVGAGSTLDRGWTTAFQVIANGTPLPGVILEVHDALGALVVQDTTDSRGYSNFHELNQYRQSGGARTYQTPHQVTAQWATFDTTFSIAADSAGTVTVDWDGAASGIKPGTVPPRFLLSQNSPNPFRTATTLHFELPADADVRLEVLDVTGRLLQTLIAERKAAGVYDIQWEPVDLASGVYWTRLTAGTFVQSRKLIRLAGRH